MASVNNSHAIFPWLFAAVLLFTAASCHTSSPDTPQPDAEKSLQAYEALHQRLQAVLAQDAAYTALLNTQPTTAALDESTGRIIQAEITLQRLIDSLDQVSSRLAAGAQKARLQKSTTYFNELLQSRRLLSDMRMALSAGSDDSASAQQRLVQLRSDIRARDEKIAALQKTHQSETQKRAAQNSSPAPLATAQTIGQLKQRNKALEGSLKAAEAKYFTVGRNYLLLKKEHERTLRELTALRKAGAQE